MDKYQALHGFWSSFGISAYDQSSVPDNATLPYITYDVYESGYDEPVPLSASLWYKGKSWQAITTKLQAISSKIGDGVYVPYTNGAILIVKGKPYAQRMADTDDSIRRILVNVMAEYIGD